MSRPVQGDHMRSTGRFRTVGWLMLAFVIALVPVSPTASSGPQQPQIFRNTLNVVRIDVIVRDKDGNVVRGLKASDFVLVEDGKPQQVTSFDFEELTTTPMLASSATSVLGLGQLQSALQRSAMSSAPAAAAASATDTMPQDLSGRRLVVLLFDTSSMQPEEITRAVKSAQQYVETQMTPADLVAIAAVGQSLTVLRDFSADRDALKGALSAFDVTAGTGFEQPVAADAADASDSTDTDPADLPLDDSEFGIFNNDRRLRAIKVLCEALAPIEQKKAILYFSAGMSRSGSDNQVELRAAINAANRANTSIYPVDSRGLTAVVPGGAAGGSGRGGGSGGSSVFSGRSMLSQFSTLSSSQETLTAIASDTGGQAFLDTNDFSPAFTRVQRDMAAYYLLGYSPANTAQDGKFRKVSVRLANPKPGYKVDARNGYYAPADFAHLKKEDREHQLQEQITAAVSLTDLPVVASTAWFRVDTGRFYVPVSVAIPGSALHLDRPASADRKNPSVDLLGVVTDEQGRSVGRIRDTIEVPAAQAAALATRQLQYQSGVTLPPGHFKVKVAVRENTEGAMGTFEFAIAIPDLKADPIKVSPVVFSTQLRSARGGGRGGAGIPGGPQAGRGFGPAGFASQRGGGGPEWGNNSVNPLLRGGQEILQSLSHVATQGQQMYFYYEVYDPATDSAGAPGLSTSLAFYRGRVKVFETPVVERSQIDAADRHAAVFQLQLPAADLKPGLYTCQVNVIDNVAGRFAFPRIAVYIKEK